MNFLGPEERQSELPTLGANIAQLEEVSGHET